MFLPSDYPGDLDDWAAEHGASGLASWSETVARHARRPRRHFTQLCAGCTRPARPGRLTCRYHARREPVSL